MHKQTGEMVFHTLAHASASAAKLQVSLNNAQTQLKMEKISSFAKDNRIKTLEELVLKIGYDPSNVKAAEEMIKKKNADIASLRKKLKIMPKEDSQAKEIAEKEGEKDEMLKLLMEKNAQLKEMEAKMERLLKEKEHMKPMEVIPLSVIPISGASTVAVTTIPSTTPLTSQEGTIDLAKSMEKMNLQEIEISRLKKEVENLQELKTSFQTSLSKEKQVTEHLRRNYSSSKRKQWQGRLWLRSKRMYG